MQIMLKFRYRKNTKSDETEVARSQFHQRFYIQIFRTKVVLAAFSSYILALAKKLFKKCARLTLMKFTVELGTKLFSELKKKLS